MNLLVHMNLRKNGREIILGMEVILAQAILTRDNFDADQIPARNAISGMKATRTLQAIFNLKDSFRQITIVRNKPQIMQS
ncbi:hypothetical protein FEM33_19865 [Dyadobacter flavalbus]|uniref:Uncharacterized protein n=1 Tax=Dyadobacter flavalbus TaxID=2579942 RepID=A0A5M8QP29_9BACT|nr:hypothetical protein [Dyadobacter flavalbus]KAA6436981.1 hypothetical protein FEM33_19865 [Dyadobacter flavalbus]